MTTIQLVTAVLIAVNLLLLASFVFSRGINTEIQKKILQKQSLQIEFSIKSLFSDRKKIFTLKKLTKPLNFLTSHQALRPSEGHCTFVEEEGGCR